MSVFVRMVIEEISKPYLYSSDGLISDSADEGINENSDSSAAAKTRTVISSIPPTRWLINLSETDIRKISSSPSQTEEMLHIPGTSNVPNFYNSSGTANYDLDSVGPKNWHKVYKNTTKNVKYIILHSLHGSAVTLYIPLAVSFGYTTPDAVITPQRKKFIFNLNPSHISPVYHKQITEIKTRGGYEIQHWGNALTEIRVQGRSRGLMPQIVSASSDSDITTSTAWQKLADLKQLYYASNSNPNTASSTTLSLTYYDTMYIGYFMDFQGPEADASSPYLVTYSFSFKITDEIPL